MNLWHGAGVNNSDQIRHLFKIRLSPIKKQQLLWTNGKINYEDENQQPIYWTNGKKESRNIRSILCEPEPWFENDTGRLEYINRIKFWRYFDFFNMNF